MSARSLRIPFGMAYDEQDKRLFVGDGWHNRVMVFDADPARLKTFPRRHRSARTAGFHQHGFGGQAPLDSISGCCSRKAAISAVTALPRSRLAVDPNSHRLFLSDGGNNRVLVFDIGAGQLHSGAEASYVLGQADFTSHAPTVIAHAPAGGGGGGDGESVGMVLATETASNYSPDSGFNSPAGLAYDARRDRLFAVDGKNGRVLVFDVGPGKLHNGMAAFAVIGQKDFRTNEATKLGAVGVPEQVGRRRFATPSGLAFDPVKDWLYVSDRGNERTLIFDVAPQKLQDDPAAIGLLGKDDFVTDVTYYAEQEEIIEPREIALDAENQRVYQTDTPMSRVLIYDLPTQERKVSLAPRAMLALSTTDPWNGRGRPQLDELKQWRPQLLSSSGLVPGALLVFSTTQQFKDAASERRSRVLTSESALTVSAPTNAAAFYLESGDHIDNTLLVGNSGTKPARVAVSLGGRSSIHIVPAAGSAAAERRRARNRDRAGFHGTVGSGHRWRGDSACDFSTAHDSGSAGTKARVGHSSGANAAGPGGRGAAGHDGRRRIRYRSRSSESYDPAAVRIGGDPRRHGGEATCVASQ